MRGPSGERGGDALDALPPQQRVGRLRASAAEGGGRGGVVGPRAVAAEEGRPAGVSVCVFLFM